MEAKLQIHPIVNRFALIVVLLPIFTIFNAYASQDSTHFNLVNGSASSFSVIENQNSISLYSKHMVLEKVSPSQQLTLKIASDNQLRISEIDIYRNNQDHELFDSHKDVSSLSIVSDVILVDSPTTFHSQLISPTVDMSGVNQYLVFLNATDYKIDASQGSFVYDIRVDNNSQVSIDGQTISPIIHLNDKIFEIHIQSEGGKVIPITGNSRIQSTWDKTEIVSDNYPLNLKINNISGKIGITGSEKDIDLASTDNLRFEQLQGTTDIENGQYQIKINSKGFAKSIALNDLDISTKLLSDNLYGKLTVLATILGIVVPSISGMIFLMKRLRRKKDEYGFILEKFVENEKEFVRLLHPSKTVEACLILCNKEPCKWWDDNSTLPRHIRTGGGGNVLLPENAEDINPMIAVMSGKQAIRKMKLKDMVLTHP